MRLAAQYSFRDGLNEITHRYPQLLTEINDVIKAVDASQLKNKISKEKAMMSRMLFEPRALNSAFKKEFFPRSWKPIKVKCEYPTTH
jgi:hypothetical protein